MVVPTFTGVEYILGNIFPPHFNVQLRIACYHCSVTLSVNGLPTDTESLLALDMKPLSLLCILILHFNTRLLHVRRGKCNSAS